MEIISILNKRILRFAEQIIEVSQFLMSPAKIFALKGKINRIKLYNILISQDFFFFSQPSREKSIGMRFLTLKCLPQRSAPFVMEKMSTCFFNDAYSLLF